MSLPVGKDAMRMLCQDAVQFVFKNDIDPSTYRGLSPFNDTRRNKPFLEMASFKTATDGLHTVPGFDSRAGASSAENFALQFVFNFLGRLSDPGSEQDMFEQGWSELVDEFADADWTYFTFCNLKNFTSPDDALGLDDGVLIRTRDFSVLSKLFGRDEAFIDDTLGRDWMEGGAGSHVMVVETHLPKAPDNLVLVNDASSFPTLMRTLLALRLSKSGFVRAGRIFFARRAKFRFGLGGITSSGQSRMDFGGTNYELRSTELPLVKGFYSALKTLDSMGDKVRSLGLALRAFSSIFERDYHRSEDRLVDSVTAIEAALRLETDLSFRSSFQVAGLLAGSDDERAAIFRDMKVFYDTRSRVVHGGELKPKHTKALQGHERLVDYVRRLLGGFVGATASDSIPATFYEDVDATLLHTGRRDALRTAFGWT